MKTLALLAALGLAVASSTPVEAAVKKSAARKAKAVSSKKKSGTAAASSTRGKLQTDVSFDDSVLHGEYQSPEEALAKVENEKGFADLIGVRKHFKDRLQEAGEQE